MELGLKRHSRAIAVEMIDIQDNSFGEQLETIVSDIKQKIDSKVFPTYKDLIDSKLPQELESMIFKRTGLQMDLTVNEDTAAIISFFANKHHIFVHPFWRGQFTIKDQQAILDKAQDKRGYVDLKKAKVGGLFSEYKNKLFINFHVLVDVYKLSVREIVAIILHEVGHAFYICEYSDRLESTNQVLANVAKEILSGKPEKNLEYVYKELKSVSDKVTEKDVDDIVNGNKVIAGYKLFKVITDSVVGQMSDDTYDKTAFEQLADHFSTRFGYARDLITGLDKLHDYFNDPQKSQSYNAFNTILSTIGLAVMTMALCAIIVNAGIIGGLIGSFYVWLIMFIAREDVVDYTYDKLKIRYKRIRNTYIEALKKLGLSNDEMKIVIENIYFIDGVISETYIPVNAFNKLSNMMFSKAKKAERSIREEQILEDLVANDLFLKAAEISLLQ